MEAAPGVGPATGRAFRELGIVSIAHLIDHLPFRHEREEAESAIESLEPGVVGSARGEVTATRPVLGRRSRFQAVLMDHSGRLDLIWFNQPWLREQIHPGDHLWVQGKPRRRGGGLELSNPAWRRVPIDDASEEEAAGARLRPVYPGSEGLVSRRIEKAVRGVLKDALMHLHDHLPEAYRRERELVELRQAYRMLHTPDDEAEVTAARRRLAYDELLLLQLGVFMRRAERSVRFRAPSLRWDEQVDQRIRARVPFELTEAQDAVARELAAELASERPANRLVQGDVGSGKTAVAVYAMLMAVASGHQAALMAPTEILAEQHHAGVSRMLAGSDVVVERVTGSLTPAERIAAEERIAAGEAHIVVGTQALTSERVRFRSLAVAVIDEQHRFGVHQRAKLRSRAGDDAVTPHTIVMTATPIPRTLALTAFGDLDVSVIRGLPPGRVPTPAEWVSAAESRAAYDAVRAAAERGERAFVVVPAVQSEGGLRDVAGTADRLRSGPLLGVAVGELHGQMKGPEREAALEAFRCGEAPVLVATTIIEVGVDVPEATVMVVEQAERFGLAQLHQLRGRVGRGGRAGRCYLVSDPPTEEARARIEALCATTDGFALAEKDLELRGAGEFSGSRQAGQFTFRRAELPRHAALLTMARRDARGWIERSPRLEWAGEELVRRRVLKAHGEALGLIDVG
ncbi:MAG: ATP-dependent DNA helicase RecG [Planctomycetota bacterium]